MPDTFGGIAAPLTPMSGSQPGTQSPRTPVQDPTLGVILNFLKAYLVTDANAETAWRVPSVDPAHPPVVGTFEWNPDEYGLQSDCFPALYAWREGGRFEWIADDWETEVATIKIRWVLPQVQQEDNMRRAPFAQALVKLIYAAFSRGRTPGWIADGDPDPLAVTQGSFVGSYLNATTAYLDLKSWKRMSLQVDMGGSSPARFPAIEITAELREKLTLDPTINTQPSSATNGVDMQITNPTTGLVQVEGHLSGTPVDD